MASRNVHALEDGAMIDSNVPAFSRSRRRDDETMQVNVQVWDRRPPPPGPQDIVAVVEDDLMRNGKTARASKHIVKRSK